jgi:hypothetical protein
LKGSFAAADAAKAEQDEEKQEGAAKEAWPLLGQFSRRFLGKFVFVP